MQCSATGTIVPPSGAGFRACAPRDWCATVAWLRSLVSKGSLESLPYTGEIGSVGEIT
jgi:hypothetical protein